MPKTREQELEQFLQDAVAFAAFCYENDREAMLLPTLLHDIMGLEERAECFSPRVSGYAEPMNHNC